MKLSQRISRIGASPTIAITTRAKQMKSDGIDVVSYGAGEPDFDTPQPIKDAAIKALQGGDTKYNPKTAQAVLKAISEKLKKENNLDYPTDQIVVTFGGKHACEALCQVLVDPGDKVLIPAPYWVSYPEMVILAGGEPVIIPTGKEANFKITPQQILDYAGDAKMIILNYPNNPSGLSYTKDELKALADAILKTDLIVISDEIYEKLIYSGTEFHSFAALDPRLMDRTITVNGLSKTYAMTGWRLGWAAGPKDVIGAVKRLMSHQTTNPVSFALAGALEAYTNPKIEEEFEKMRVEFEKRGKYMAARLNAINGVQCLEPTGAFYCFPDVSAHYGRTIEGIAVTDSMSLAKAALEKANVALVPGSAFGDDNCVRLSFATSMEQIDKGLDRLEKLLG